MRFLLSRRWLLFAIGVVVLAWLCVRLGEWQFHRLHDKEQRNTWTEQNLAADPAPVTDVFSPSARLPEDREWLRVTATGTYDTANTVVVRYQTREGESGVDVVTPLKLSDGSAVLVDRGWAATPNTGTRPDDLPAPPAGEVSITGWARADATGNSTSVTDQSTRAVSSLAIAKTLDYPVLRGFVDLTAESPTPAEPLVAAEQPDLGNGPHFFYGIQWWFFGALAVFGFGYLVYDEWRRARRTADEPVSRTGSTSTP